MAKKATKSSAASIEGASAASAKKSSAPRVKKHLTAQAAGVAAAVEGFVSAMVSPIEGRVASIPQEDHVTEAEGIEVSHEAISKLAYEFFLQRHGQNGSPADDWIRAEQALRSGSLR